MGGFLGTGGGPPVHFAARASFSTKKHLDLGCNPRPSHFSTFVSHQLGGLDSHSIA